MSASKTGAKAKAPRCRCGHSRGLHWRVKYREREYQDGCARCTCLTFLSPQGRPRAIPEELAPTVLALHRQGLGPKAISTALYKQGCLASSFTVRRWLGERQVRQVFAGPGGRPRILSGRLSDTVSLLHRQGRGYRDIAQELARQGVQCHWTTVARTLKRLEEI